MTQRTQRAQQIRISDVLYSMLKHRMLIIIMTVIGLVVGILLSVVSYMRGEMSKQYAITSTIAVVSQTKDGLFSTKTTNPVSQDIYLAENMVDSVIYLIKSDRTLDAAVEKLSLVGISTRDISRNLTLKQYNSTQIIEMTLYWRSAEEGVQILSAINAVAPNILIDILKIGDVSIVNKPTARYLIGGNVNASMWVYMALLGMMAGAGFSVLMLLLYPTVINIRDLESDFGLEVLGQIPQDKACFARRRALLVNDPEGSDFEYIRQSFATTAHILGNRLGSEEHQCIFITSSAPNEGKTTIVANLAIHLSDLEKRVLVIDFDVRHPSLGTMFLDKVEYIHSLNALYRGETTTAEAITTLTGYLDLLPSILEPHELPLDDAMMNLVRELSVKYDYVLMDTSPVGRVATTMNLNRIAKSAIFVVGYDKTTKDEIGQSLEKMDKSGVRIIGCVVNGVRKSGRDAWNYGSGYYKSKKGTDPSGPKRGILEKKPDETDEAADEQDALIQAQANKAPIPAQVQESEIPADAESKAGAALPDDVSEDISAYDDDDFSDDWNTPSTVSGHAWDRDDETGSDWKALDDDPDDDWGSDSNDAARQPAYDASRDWDDDDDDDFDDFPASSVNAPINDADEDDNSDNFPAPSANMPNDDPDEDDSYEDDSPAPSVNMPNDDLDEDPDDFWDDDDKSGDAWDDDDDSGDTWDDDDDSGDTWDDDVDNPDDARDDDVDNPDDARDDDVDASPEVTQPSDAQQENQPVTPANDIPPASASKPNTLAKLLPLAAVKPKKRRKRRPNQASTKLPPKTSTSRKAPSSPGTGAGSLPRGAIIHNLQAKP